MYIGSGNEQKEKEYSWKVFYSDRDDPNVSEAQAISETTKIIAKAWLYIIFPAAILLYLLYYFLLS